MPWRPCGCHGSAIHSEHSHELIWLTTDGAFLYSSTTWCHVRDSADWYQIRRTSNRNLLITTFRRRFASWRTSGFYSGRKWYQTTRNNNEYSLSKANWQSMVDIPVSKALSCVGWMQAFGLSIIYAITWWTWFFFLFLLKHSGFITKPWNFIRKKNCKNVWKWTFLTNFMVFVSCKFLVITYRKSQWLTWILHCSPTKKAFNMWITYHESPEINFRQECSVSLPSTVLNLYTALLWTTIEAVFVECWLQPKLLDFDCFNLTNDCGDSAC